MGFIQGIAKFISGAVHNSPCTGSISGCSYFIAGSTNSGVVHDSLFSGSFNKGTGICSEYLNYSVNYGTQSGGKFNDSTNSGQGSGYLCFGSGAKNYGTICGTGDFNEETENFGCVSDLVLCDLSFNCGNYSNLNFLITTPVPTNKYSSNLCSDAKWRTFLLGSATTADGPYSNYFIYSGDLTDCTTLPEDVKAKNGVNKYYVYITGEAYTCSCTVDPCYYSNNFILQAGMSTYYSCLGFGTDCSVDYSICADSVEYAGCYEYSGMVNNLTCQFFKTLSGKALRCIGSIRKTARIDVYSEANYNGDPVPFICETSYIEDGPVLGTYHASVDENGIPCILALTCKSGDKIGGTGNVNFTTGDVRNSSSASATTSMSVGCVTCTLTCIWICPTSITQNDFTYETTETYKDNGCLLHTYAYYPATYVGGNCIGTICYVSTGGCVPNRINSLCASGTVILAGADINTGWRNATLKLGIASYKSDGIDDVYAENSYCASGTCLGQTGLFVSQLTNYNNINHVPIANCLYGTVCAKSNGLGSIYEIQNKCSSGTLFGSENVTSGASIVLGCVNYKFDGVECIYNQCISRPYGTALFSGRKSSKTLTVFKKSYSTYNVCMCTINGPCDLYCVCVCLGEPTGFNIELQNLTEDFYSDGDMGFYTQTGFAPYGDLLYTNTGVDCIDFVCCFIYDNDTLSCVDYTSSSFCLSPMISGGAGIDELGLYCIYSNGAGDIYSNPPTGNAGNTNYVAISGYDDSMNAVVIYTPCNCGLAYNDCEFTSAYPYSSFILSSGFGGANNPFETICKIGLVNCSIVNCYSQVTVCAANWADSCEDFCYNYCYSSNIVYVCNSCYYDDASLTSYSNGLYLEYIFVPCQLVYDQYCLINGCFCNIHIC